MRTPRLLLPLACSLALATIASADVNAWVNQVNAGTTSVFLNSSVPASTSVDIGTPASTAGITYEFVVNASNTGTSALIGARGTGLGSNSAIKFEQYLNTQSYGVTHFGVSDLSFAGANHPDEDVHLVFFSDPAAGTTELHVNGVSRGTVPHAVVLEGMVGLGQAHDPNGAIDLLTSSLLGVVIYEGPYRRPRSKPIRTPSIAAPAPA